MSSITLGTLGRLIQHFKSLSPPPTDVKRAISTHQDESEDKVRSSMSSTYYSTQSMSGMGYLGDAVPHISTS